MRYTLVFVDQYRVKNIRVHCENRFAESRLIFFYLYQLVEMVCYCFLLSRSKDKERDERQTRSRIDVLSASIRAKREGGRRRGDWRVGRRLEFKNS